MALERLQSVFNNIEDNVQSLEDGIPVESISNSVNDDIHSFGTQGNRNELIKIAKINKQQNPSPLVAINGIFAEDGTITPINPINGHNFRQIRINDNNGTNLLQTVGTEYSGDVGFGEVVSNEPNLRLDKLGKGDFILEKLFDPTHGNNYDDRVRLGGQGSTANLNIFSKSTFHVRGTEPSIVHPIGFSEPNQRKLGYDRDGFPLRAAKEDVSRLLSYYLSRDGIKFMLKENITNLAIGDGITLGEGANRFLMMPPLPVPMTGFLNAYQQKFQSSFPSTELYKSSVVDGKTVKTEIFKFNGLTNGSLRKPARVNYSQLSGGVRAPLVLKIQGDVPKELLKNEQNPLEKLEAKFEATRKLELEKEQPDPLTDGNTHFPLTKKQKFKNVGKSIYNLGASGFDKVNELRIKGQEALRKKLIEQMDDFVKLPILENPTKNFLDLSGFGDHSDSSHGYDDKISQKGVTFSSMEQKKEIDAGDFYLRIHDLRSGALLYFRGFVTGITENLTPSWNPTTYIGRSEDVWVYQKGERDLSFNLRVAAANIKEFSAMNAKMDRLTSLVYPEYYGRKGNQRMKPPFTELYLGHIGSQNLGQFGYIKSLTYTVNEQGDWDALTKKPRVFDIAISYQILHMEPPSDLTKFYGATTIGGVNE